MSNTYEERIMFKIFVYGTLRKGLSNDINNMAKRVGARIKYLGIDTVEAEMYSYVWFPAIAFNPNSDNNVQVVGEIYEIRSEEEAMLKSLDALEGYPYHYNRKKIHTKYGKAWVYFFDTPPKIPSLTTGDWKDLA